MDYLDNSEVALRFGAVARQFCSIVDAAAGADKTALLLDIYRVLPHLISEAVNLPEITLADGNSEIMAPPRPAILARQTQEEWNHLYFLLKERLGDWDLYWQVFDPTKDKEAIPGSLADDIADIYRDLRKGLALSDLRPPNEAVRMWRVLFHSHWGQHAMEALRTIHSRLEDTFF